MAPNAGAVTFVFTLPAPKPPPENDGAIGKLAPIEPVAVFDIIGFPNVAGLCIDDGF